MSERTYTTTNGYRYGFNGQEKDDEVAGEGNSNTAEFWQFDTRLGRRWNLDPIPDAEISSYVCLYNSPIFFNDLNGDIPGGGDDKPLVSRSASDVSEEVKLKRVLLHLQQQKVDINVQITSKKIELVAQLKASKQMVDAGVFLGDISSFIPGKSKLQTVILELIGLGAGSLDVLSQDLSNKIEVAEVDLEKQTESLQKDIKKLREQAVDLAWAEEIDLIEKTGKGTRDWSAAEIEEMKKTGKVKGYAGHHINDVKNHPELAGNPDNIEFLKTDNKKSGGAKKGSEHYNKHYDSNGKRIKITKGDLIPRKRK